MLRKFAFLTLVVLALSGCSYGYDLIAVVRDGRLVFMVNPASSKQPLCLRRVEVAEDDRSRAPLWLESVSYDDDCMNHYPLIYGKKFKGEHEGDYRQIVAQPLRREVIYNVSVTTGASGYGGGRFIIHADGQVENLKYPTHPSQADNATQP